MRRGHEQAEISGIDQLVQRLVANDAHAPSQFAMNKQVLDDLEVEGSWQILDASTSAPCAHVGTSGSAATRANSAKSSAMSNGDLFLAAAGVPY